MTILYEGFDGHIANPILGWSLIAIGILFFIGFIWLVKNGNEEGSIITLLGFGLAFVLAGVFVMKDGRYPITKVAINEEMSWQDINNKYELMEQEGQIYTFKVKNITNEEWENHLKEKESK